MDILKDKYSSIEECKADITGIYNIKHLFHMKLVDDLYVKKMKALVRVDENIVMKNPTKVSYWK